MNNKAPQIRFKDFTESWEQRELKSFVDKAVDNRGKTPPISTDGTHPLIEVAALGYGAPNYQKVEKYLDDYSFDNCLRDYLKEGDILFSTVGSIGDVALMDSNEKACIAQNIVSFRAKNDYYPKFLYSLFSTEKNQQLALRIVMGAVQPSIKVSQLIHVEYPFLNCIDEQIKIGDLFYSIDSLITLHQRKHEQFNILKKTLLNKMFPNGSNKPDIRFKEFNEPWEQCKLGDFGKCKSGIGFPDSQQGGQTGIPFFKVSDMNTAGNEKIMHISNNYVTEQQIKNNSWNVIKSPAVFFAKVGAAVMLNRKRLILTDFLLDNNTMTYPINTDSFDTDFCYTLFETIDLPSLVQVGALPSYNANQVDNIEVSIPNNLEQTKIGSIFNNLDNLITLHQQKCEHLKNMKQSLLSKMFV